MHAHACTYVCNGCCSPLIVLIAAQMQVFIPVSAQLKALACHEELAYESCLHSKGCPEHEVWISLRQSDSAQNRCAWTIAHINDLRLLTNDMFWTAFRCYKICC